MENKIIRKGNTQTKFQQKSHIYILLQLIQQQWHLIG